MSRTENQRKPPTARRVALLVGLSVAAHVLGMLVIGALLRTCDPPETPEPRRLGEVQLETHEEGPGGKKITSGDSTRPPGLPVTSSPNTAEDKTPRLPKEPRAIPAPAKRLAKAPTKPARKQADKPRPKPAKRPVKKAKPQPKPVVVAAKPPPDPVQRSPKTEPKPNTPASPLDMRGARRDPDDPQGTREWKKWKDIDPELAAQLRWGALPRLDRVQPTRRALAAAFPAEKLKPKRVVGKHVTATTYADGGRVVVNRTNRNVEVPPRFGRQAGTPGYVVRVRSGVRLPRGIPRTLKGLANLHIPGKGSGRVSCDLYRWDPTADPRREVVIFVDTSGSMAHKIGRAQICAAGIARSALKKGFKVAVFNFSDFAYFQEPTRDRKKLHRILALNIGGFTALPRIRDKDLPSTSVGRDFVVVSDGMFNKHIRGSIASHRDAYRSNKANRAFFYLFGSALHKHLRHPASIFARLKRLGYRTRNMLKIRRTGAVAAKPKPKAKARAKR